MEHPGARGARCIPKLTFAVNHALDRLAGGDGLRPQGYHAGNILIHLLAALTLLGLVRRTLNLPRWRKRWEDSATGIALAVALLWMLHPLVTQAISYTVQRHESLMGLFYLLTLYGLLRQSQAPGPVGRWGWGAATVVVCALGDRQALLLDVLAAAQAEVGRLDQAVATAQRALAAASAGGEAGLAQLIQRHLRAYTQGHAWRDPSGLHQVPR